LLKMRNTPGQRPKKAQFTADQQLVQGLGKARRSLLVP
jgi:hypothetical protein